jgi:hypothetical protein
MTRQPEELTRDELLAVVRAVRGMLYATVDDDGSDVWDPDHPVAGADFVEGVARELERYGLVPDAGPIAGSAPSGAERRA